MKERKRTINFKFCFVKLFFVPSINTNAEHYFNHALWLSSCIIYSLQTFLYKNVTNMFTAYQLMTIEILNNKKKSLK